MCKYGAEIVIQGIKHLLERVSEWVYACYGKNVLTFSPTNILPLMSTRIPPHRPIHIWYISNIYEAVYSFHIISECSTFVWFQHLHNWRLIKRFLHLMQKWFNFILQNCYIEIRVIMLLSLGQSHFSWCYRIQVKIWVVTPSDVVGYQCFRGPCCLDLQGKLEMEAARSSKMLVSYHNTTRCTTQKTSTWIFTVMKTLYLTMVQKFLFHLIC
jgi:hypothetical protein